MQHKLHLQIIMSSGLAKRDNRIVTLFLFVQALDLLLDCRLMRFFSNSNNNPSKRLEADTWIQHMTLLIIKVLKK